MADKIEWTTQIRKIKELIPFPNNPRKMSKEQAKNLLDSLEKFDYVELVAINADNTILAGHMRIQAMQKMGWGKKEIEVRVPNRLLTEHEAREYLIRSNKNVGTWDFDVLAAWQHDLLKECGFTTDELCEIFDIEEEDETVCEKEKSVTECPKCGYKF
jgi:ParB-like chromosome segregation protein Spo0J